MGSPSPRFAMLVSNHGDYMTTAHTWFNWVRFFAMEFCNFSNAAKFQRRPNVQNHFVCCQVCVKRRTQLPHFKPSHITKTSSKCFCLTPCSNVNLRKTTRSCFSIRALQFINDLCKKCTLYNCNKHRCRQWRRRGCTGCTCSPR